MCVGPLAVPRHSEGALCLLCLSSELLHGLSLQPHHFILPYLVQHPKSPQVSFCSQYDTLHVALLILFTLIKVGK